MPWVDTDRSLAPVKDVKQLCSNIEMLQNGNSKDQIGIESFYLTNILCVITDMVLLINKIQLFVVLFFLFLGFH